MRMYLGSTKSSWYIHVKTYSRFLSLLMLAGVCAACVSSGPATNYFSLFAIKQTPEETQELADKSLSFGVGPIIIPEYMDNPSIVSVTKQQAVKVSGQNAWAGDLKVAMGRVLADNLSQYWQLDKVSAFPWDNRLRPSYQIRLAFDEFGGERGGEVRLRVAWSLMNKRGDKLHLSKRAGFAATTTDPSAESYVAALNQLLNQLSAELAVEVKNYLGEQVAAE